MSNEDKTIIKPASVGGGGIPFLKEPTIINAGPTSREGSEESFSSTPKPRMLLTEMVQAQLDEHKSVLAQQLQEMVSRMDRQRYEDSTRLLEMMERIQMQNAVSQVVAPRGLSPPVTPLTRQSSNRQDFDPSEDIQDEEEFG